MKPIDHPFERGSSFDVVLAVCGYETRSSYVARLGVEGGTKLAVTYKSPAGGALEANRLLYEIEGWTFIAASSLREALHRALAGRGGAGRICVDISSMARRTLATVVEVLWTLSAQHPFEVQFLYCPATFDSSSKAARRVEALNAGPVSDYFAGELRSPSIPVGLVVGLGLEPHRALGLTELVEPTKTWAFVSDSEDARFAAEAARMHTPLFDAPANSALFHYDVRSLAEPYGALESLSFSAGLRYRLLFAPSGPKIFSLACLLVAAPRVSSRPAVWRVGTATRSEAIDIEEAGDVVASSVLFDSRS
ncbi:hypothetical protein AVP42_00783 [Agromyces sp. NDB4Y10]|uniref:hypothetical protein n=1 Tax=Agromyces sp. NDB4Y10 TaxID=1775951 RepID=UPI0007B2268C|nr:hypothetical protein [Agromyces sp. NDB4Y10]KZE94856.1 hypothetical protein AVP42_00783 [Agromyces sp. NDB4Y10]